jgi:hypothetical protein
MIPEATRVSKMECARKFAAQMGYVDDFLEAVVAPPEEEAPPTEPEDVVEDKLAEGLYVTSSNSPLRRRMFFAPFAQHLTFSCRKGKRWRRGREGKGSQRA